MPSDTARPENRRDPRDGTAAIAPITGAMMDHAAHEAAALADGVAHGTIAIETRAAKTPDAADPTPASAVEPVMPSAERAVDATVDVARDAVAAAGTAVSDASTDALSRYSAKAFEMMQANVASTTALFAALVQARSVPEAVSLNADHLRRQMETLTSQGRELATLAQRVALDALQPFKGTRER